MNDRDKNFVGVSKPDDIVYGPKGVSLKDGIIVILLLGGGLWALQSGLHAYGSLTTAGSLQQLRAVKSILFGGFCAGIGILALLGLIKSLFNARKGFPRLILSADRLRVEYPTKQYFAAWDSLGAFENKPPSVIIKAKLTGSNASDYIKRLKVFVIPRVNADVATLVWQLNHHRAQALDKTFDDAPVVAVSAEIEKNHRSQSKTLYTLLWFAGAFLICFVAGILIMALIKLNDASVDVNQGAKINIISATIIALVIAKYKARKKFPRV